MLEITNDNIIYLTKGDSGVINIEVSGSDVSTMDLVFTVRNAQNLDTEMFSLTSAEAQGTDDGIIEHESGTNKWTVTIYKEATQGLKRKKYVYDFAVEDTVTHGDKITFVGGGKEKLEFWVT